MAEPAKAAGGYLYHPIYGKSAFMYQVDMTGVKDGVPIGALVRFPDEWKDRPWTEREIEDWKKRNAPAEMRTEAQEQKPAQAPKKRGRPFTKKEPQTVAAE
ncbi:MAG TPA: hypothetical protein VFN27_16940 [Xanthobacteraceae bacterium]|nr:hypothetical protein [Xanthobacteraceae bacterium]